MPRGVTDCPRQIAQFQNITLVEASNLPWFGQISVERSANEIGHVRGQTRPWVSQQVPVGSVDVTGYLVVVGNRGRRGYMVDVTVGTQHCCGVEIVPAHQIGNKVNRVNAWIYHDAIGPDLPNDVAVGLQRARGKGRQKHAPRLAALFLVFATWPRRNLWNKSGKISCMSDTASPKPYGRVDEDGTVYVLTSDGERKVGQIPDATPAEALAFYVKRFEALELEVQILQTRVQNGALSPEDARQTIRSLKKSIESANAVGDLAALLARLDALTPLLAEQTEARKAERSRQHAATRAAKEAMVAEAELLAAGTDWRSGVNRFRDLLDDWKALPRIDRVTDDELWHRFSTARTTYTRRRKTQFAEQTQRREQSQKVKEEILAEARVLAQSTDWGATSSAFRDLMTRWKAAGSAQREVDDALWTEFRSLQDAFFNAREQSNKEQDAEYHGNLQAKETLLAAIEAEVLPVRNVAQARAAYRQFLEKFNSIGHVPRDSIRSLDQRVRAIDSAIHKAEEDEWRRTDPVARARAEETVVMLSKQIARLDEQAAKAAAAGKHKDAAKARDSIATYRTWLEQAQATLATFSS